MNIDKAVIGLLFVVCCFFFFQSLQAQALGLIVAGN